MDDKRLPSPTTYDVTTYQQVLDLLAAINDGTATDEQRKQHDELESEYRKELDSFDFKATKSATLRDLWLAVGAARWSRYLPFKNTFGEYCARPRHE